MLVADIFDANGQLVGSECNTVLGDTTGTDYTIKISWDFTSEPGVEQVFIDNTLIRGCTQTQKPINNGGKIYLGELTSVVITP